MRKFTFHNVSINSRLYDPFYKGHKLFTFHNVSINSCSHSLISAAASKFTFHNVSINSEAKLRKGYIVLFDLHSIMYLLILPPFSYCCPAISTFTFHNVSINSHKNTTTVAKENTIYIP